MHEWNMKNTKLMHYIVYFNDTHTIADIIMVMHMKSFYTALGNHGSCGIHGLQQCTMRQFLCKNTATHIDNGDSHSI